MIKLSIKNIGYISFSEPSKNEDTVFVQFLFVEENYRRKGYGTYLLWNLFHYLRKTYKNIKYVEGDDCSDRYGLDENVYKKIGCKYKYKNQPEMIFNLLDRNILQVYKKIKNLLDMKDIDITHITPS